LKFSELFLNLHILPINIIRFLSVFKSQRCTISIHFQVIRIFIKFLKEVMLIVSILETNKSFTHKSWYFKLVYCQLILLCSLIRLFMFDFSFNYVSTIIFENYRIRNFLAESNIVLVYDFNLMRQMSYIFSSKCIMVFMFVIKKTMLHCLFVSLIFQKMLH
jgi:hypothetical protein